MTIKTARGRAGFTIVELLVVLVIIGLLLVLVIPNYLRYRTHAKIARTAEEIRNLATAFVAYKAIDGTYPPDSHVSLPPGMERFINPQIWADETPLGGHYNWEGPDTYGYAGVSIFNSAAPEEHFRILDGMLDDGNLVIGRFRYGSGGRPTLIIEDDS